MILSATANLHAQCCSPGNPVAGASQVGILAPYTLRTVTYFRTSYSDTYYKKDHKTGREGSYARYNYIGEIISFGLPKRFTTELELGYFLEKTQDSDPTTPAQQDLRVFQRRSQPEIRIPQNPETL